MEYFQSIYGTWLVCDAATGELVSVMNTEYAKEWASEADVLRDHPNAKPCLEMGAD